jgi:hypothetical protein
MQAWKVIAVVGTIAALAFIAANCSDPVEGQPDGCYPNCPENVPPACDPDGRAPCPDTWFICTEDGHGGKTCEEEAPVPDGGDWDCYQDGTTLVCVGDHVPEGGDWNCVPIDEETVECTSHAHEPATDGGGEGHWECEYEGEFRICEWVDDGGSGGDADSDTDTDTDTDADAPPDDGGGRCPPGIEIPTDEICDDGIDNDCDGRTDETCPDWVEPPCVCIPGAVRYCDTPDYCLWGTQVCEDDGMDWTLCIEVRTIPSECAAIDSWYSPAAAACCIDAGFCCHDKWDMDHDGDTWESRGDCVDIICVPEPEPGGE